MSWFDTIHVFATLQMKITLMIRTYYNNNKIIQNTCYLEPNYKENVFKRRKSIRKFWVRSGKLDTGGKTLFREKFSRKNGVKFLGCTGKCLKFSVQSYIRIDLKMTQGFEILSQLINMLLWPFTICHIKGDEEKWKCIWDW